MITMPLETIRALLTDWFVYFATRAGIPLAQRGGGTDNYTVSDGAARVVTASFLDSPPYVSFSTQARDDQRVVEQAASAAWQRVSSGDFGSEVWYSVALTEAPFNFFSAHGGTPAFLLRLGTQQRIVGWRRLGGSILLEFSESSSANNSSESSPFAPLAQVSVHIAVPAPLVGFFSDLVVHGLIEPISAICTFALGRPVDVPPIIFSEDTDLQRQAIARRSDPTVLTLARKGVSLDVFSALTHDGGRQWSDHARAALLTFDAAVRQDRETVASVLYVVAAESLTVPATSWRDKRLVARFIDFYLREMAADLDVIVNHPNFEESFDIKRGTKSAGSLRKLLLEKLYGLRSLQVHEGLRTSYRGMLIGSKTGSDMQRALIHDFAEAAILSYLSVPRSSLIGHPGTAVPSDAG